MNQTIKIVIIITALVGAFYQTSQYFELHSQQIKNEAVSSCLTASGTYEYSDKDKGIKTTAPQKEYYRVCMSDKGYQTVWQ